MMRRRQRDEIETFCRNFSHGNSGHQQLRELIGNYERESSQIDIQQLFTKDTFDGSFRSICNDVFIHRPVSNGYIIAILAFTEAVHKHHSSSSCYTIDILTISLVNVLEGIGFHPEQLAPSLCIILCVYSFTRRLLLSKHIMGKFYLDLEFTNGNFYLSDIFDLVLLSEESGYAFHSYVKIHYSVPKRGAAVNRYYK